MVTQEEHFERAKQVMPGGVNSSTRLGAALGVPMYVSRGDGAHVIDLEGRRFIDLCCAHGAALLGHGHPAVSKALSKANELGHLHAMETEHHERLARLVCEAVPCAERVRFCSAGSEATLHLIRLCRGYTGRNKIVRIEGHFHGYHEMIYIGGHPPPNPAALESNRQHPYLESPGMPAQLAELIIPVPHNDIEAVKQAIERDGDDIAMVILEPVNFNTAGIAPAPGYLQELRRITANAGIILFFDEIQSVFKKSVGGAQLDFGVTPDVATLGKSLGGGLPLSALCGKAEIMDHLKPFGPVQHSGTFNAHLVPVLSGLAFVEQAMAPAFYEHLRTLEQRLHDGVDRIIADRDLNMHWPRHGARFNILLGRREPARRYDDTFCHDNKLMLKIIRGCWERGVWMHDYGGGPLHHGYSIQHTTDDIDTVLNVLDDVLGQRDN